MAKQKGREMLVKLGDGAGSETFNSLCGLTAKSLSINNEAIDVTTADCTTPGGPLWRESIDGVKSLEISGEGIFKDEASELRANTIALANSPVVNAQVVVPAFGTYSGAWFLSQLQLSGNVDGAVTYSITLQSNGTVAFA